jgi:hypothetical protein
MHGRAKDRARTRVTVTSDRERERGRFKKRNHVATSSAVASLTVAGCDGSVQKSILDASSVRWHAACVFGMIDTRRSRLAGARVGCSLSRTRIYEMNEYIMIGRNVAKSAQRWNDTRKRKENSSAEELSKAREKGCSGPPFLGGFCFYTR